MGEVAFCEMFTLEKLFTDRILETNRFVYVWAMSACSALEHAQFIFGFRFGSSVDFVFDNAQFKVLTL